MKKCLSKALKNTLKTKAYNLLQLCYYYNLNSQCQIKVHHMELILICNFLPQKVWSLSVRIRAKMAWILRKRNNPRNEKLN